MEIRRVKSGIPELDGKIEGGFFRPSMVLVMGPPGSGKTTFSLQYLFEGIKHREKGILFSTLSESSSSLIQFASHFWFIDSKSFGTKLFVVDLNPKLKTSETRDQFVSEIDEKVRKFNAKRIVIDPINLIQLSLSDLKEYRLFIFELSNYIKEHGLQALVTAELYDDNYHCHESYICDGTLLLQTNEKQGKMERNITIVKMRGTRHELEPIEYIITKNGIQLKV